MGNEKRSVLSQTQDGKQSAYHNVVKEIMVENTILWHTYKEKNTFHTKLSRCSYDLTQLRVPEDSYQNKQNKVKYANSDRCKEKEKRSCSKQHCQKSKAEGTLKLRN